MNKKISIFLGTRPEAIKLAPVILKLYANNNFECHVCVTGQHKEMLQQVLDVFGILPDKNLKLMSHNQSLPGLTSRAITAISDYLEEYKPDIILVQGDTTTVFTAAMASFYKKIPIAHLEAGLRTGDKYSPFPEEINRVLTSRLADIHFSPTNNSRKNLISEGIPEDRVFVTGNTVIDALLTTVENVRSNPPKIDGLPKYIQPSNCGKPNPNKIILITGHRRENFGTGFNNICNAISLLAQKYPEVHFVYPVHLNPNVYNVVTKMLGSPAINNIHLIAPLQYEAFIALMDKAYIVLTDSGGVQEEAPSLGKPVLVMRNTTERPEAVDAGTAKLVGTSKNEIINNVSLLLDDDKSYTKMAKVANPYGDGQASDRIINLFESYFGI